LWHDFSDILIAPGFCGLFYLRHLSMPSIFRALFIEELEMSRICEVCGKGPRTGNTIVRRGLAKSKGGIGLHTTGITRRRYLPNLQKIRVVENGGVKTRRVCTSCIKAGKVSKV